MNEERYVVVKTGGSVGDRKSTLETMSKADAQAKAKRMNQLLSVGEKKYYHIRYSAIPVATAKNRGWTLKESSIWSELDTDYDTEYFRESNFKKIDEEFDKLTDNYMETESPGEFLGSEILAAANKLIYRYFNDGDVLNEGYGKETCNPAYRFLKQTLSPKNADGITASHYDKYEDFLKAIEYYVVWEFGRNPELSRTKNDKGSYLNY